MRCAIVAVCCASLAACTTLPRYSQADDGPSGVTKPPVVDETRWGERIGWLSLAAVGIGIAFAARHTHNNGTRPAPTTCLASPTPGDPFCKTP